MFLLLLSLLFAGVRPLVHQNRSALSTTRLLLADEVRHFLGTLGRIINKATRLIVLVVKLCLCLKIWSCVIELQVSLQDAFVELIYSIIACLMILLTLEWWVESSTWVIEYDVGSIWLVFGRAHPLFYSISKTANGRHRHWTENRLELGCRGWCRSWHELLLSIVCMWW